jgi:antitoxin PrlF
MPSSARKTVYSKISVKSQTVVPAEVRERLRIKPGDRLRYVIDDTGVRIERSTPNEEDDPFATFTEWASDADDEAYADL